MGEEMNLKSIPVEKVKQGDSNSRSELGDLTDLIASIKSVGVKEPILVKQLDNEEGEFEVFAGFRRLAASIQAENKTIPCIVHTRRSVSRKQMLILNVTENVQREDLNPIDEANALARLQEEYSLSNEQICSQIGIKPARLSQRFRLLQLTDTVQEAIKCGLISLTAAFEIDRLPKSRQEHFVSIAQELSGTRFSKLIDKELAKLDKQETLSKTKKESMTPIITELVRSTRQSLRGILDFMDYEKDVVTRLVDVNFRSLEVEDLRVVSSFIDDVAERFPQEIEFNDKAAEEIVSVVEGGNISLDLESPLVRQALIAGIRVRAVEIAKESSKGKRPRVSYVNAQAAIGEFSREEDLE
jgi:ParB/RepB/Spo0J family partition protein